MESAANVYDLSRRPLVRSVFPPPQIPGRTIWHDVPIGVAWREEDFDLSPPPLVATPETPTYSNIVIPETQYGPLDEESAVNTTAPLVNNTEEVSTGLCLVNLYYLSMRHCIQTFFRKS
jgi:hypothetical protein